MLPKNEVLNIINHIIYDDTKDIEYLKSKLAIDKEDEILLITRDIFIRLSITNKTLLLEDIKLARDLKNKGFCFKLIGELIKLSKEDKDIEAFEVCSIISSRMYSICEYYKMEDIPNAHYGDIDEDYDFDGLFGSKRITTK